MIDKPPNPEYSLEKVSVVDPAFWRRSDRDEVFAQFRREAPVWWHPDTDSVRDFWSVSKHAEVELVSRDWKTFCSGFGTSITDESIELSRLLEGMLNSDAPEHVRLRRIVNKAFAPNTIQQLKHP